MRIEIGSPTRPTTAIIHPGAGLLLSALVIIIGMTAIPPAVAIFLMIAIVAVLAIGSFMFIRAYLAHADDGDHDE